MFRELMPLLRERTLILTLSRIDDATMRVCVIPKRLKEDAKEDTAETALCMPLTVAANVDELERDFSAQLTRYTISVVALGSNLAQVEAKHSAAVRAVEAEKTDELNKKRGKATRTNNAAARPGPVIRDGKPVFGTKNGESAEASMPSQAAQEPTVVAEQLTGAGPVATDLAREDGNERELLATHDNHPVADSAPAGTQGSLLYPA